jgi:DNA mismatch repair protein MSH6
MRTKGGPQDKIVKRELHQVFTNGTIVDPTYLTTDEANHCVAIKVGRNAEKNASR